MSTQTNPLAGDPYPQQPPVSQPDAAPEAEAPDMAGALSGDFAVPTGPPFAQQVATGADTAAAAMPPAAARQPGAWARALVAGVQDALSGFGAGGRVPPGAGGLYGLGAGVREAQANATQQQARQDKLNQQNIENQRAQTAQQQKADLDKATIAHENAGTVYQQQLTSRLSYDARQQDIATGKTAVGPLEQAGAPIIQEGIDSDEAQRLIQEKKLNPTQQHAFPTGEKPILDADGKEQMDAEGHMLGRPTYTVIGDVPEVTIDAATAKLISDNTKYKFPEGTKLSGTTYGTVVQQAINAQTATAAINETRKKAKLEDLSLDEQLSAQNMLPDWSKALAKAGNDPQKALRYMESNPQMKQKYPDIATTVQSLYGGGGKWQEMVDKQEAENLKARELTDKEQAKGSYEGDPKAATPQQFLSSLAPDEQSVVKLIGEGRAPLNNPGYLLARKPEILNAVAKAYPDFDSSKVGSYQQVYKDFTSGKSATELQSGAVALQHLRDLKNLNTPASRIPKTPAWTAYHNLADTVAGELGRFYGNTTETAREDYKKTLSSDIGSRDAAIVRQTQSMGERMDTYDEKWKEAAPSKAYEAQMPGVYRKAVQARAEVDPLYVPSAGMNVSVPQQAPAQGSPTNPNVSTGGANFFQQFGGLAH